MGIEKKKGGSRAFKSLFRQNQITVTRPEERIGMTILRVASEYLLSPPFEA